MTIRFFQNCVSKSLQVNSYEPHRKKDGHQQHRSIIQAVELFVCKNGYIDANRNIPTLIHLDNQKNLHSFAL